MPRLLGSLHEFAKVDLPRTLTLLKLDGKDGSDIRRDDTRIFGDGEATNERQRNKAVVSLVLEIPLLTLQSDAHGLHEVDAGSRDRCPGDGPEVRQRENFLWGRLQEQIAERGMKGMRQVLSLPEGGPAFAALPRGKLFGSDARSLRRVFDRQTHALTCPAQLRWIDECLSRHGRRIRDG